MPIRKSVFGKVSPVQRSLQVRNLLDRVDALERGYKGQQVRNVVVNYITDLGANAAYPTVEQTVTIVNNTVVNINNQVTWQRPFLFDDFIGGSVVLGELCWGQNSLDVLPGTPSVSHPGVINIFPNVVNNPCVMFLAPVLGTTSMVVDGFEWVQFALKIDAAFDTAGDYLMFGVVDDTVMTDGVLADGIFFCLEYGDTYWKTRTVEAGSYSEVLSAVAFAADTWFMFEIKKTVLGFDFYINGAFQSSINVGVATTEELAPTLAMNGVLGTWQVALDFFGMQVADITQRWD